MEMKASSGALVLRYHWCLLGWTDSLGPDWKGSQ